MSSNRFDVIAQDIAVNMQDANRIGMRFNGVIDQVVKNWDTIFGSKLGVDFDDVKASEIGDDVKEYYETLL